MTCSQRRRFLHVDTSPWNRRSGVATRSWTGVQSDPLGVVRVVGATFVTAFSPPPPISEKQQQQKKSYTDKKVRSNGVVSGISIWWGHLCVCVRVFHCTFVSVHEWWRWSMHCNETECFVFFVTALAHRIYCKLILEHGGKRSLFRLLSSALCDANLYVVGCFCFFFFHEFLQPSLGL